ncbi:hypothetical protein HK102_000252 [Quaeritorhiza haematococci]|nr:hypothetical protein HK102_000252 [Quaeritorhiza haematococci]
MSWFFEVRNNALAYPDDFVRPWYYAAGWAIAHYSITNFVLKPAARRLCRTSTIASKPVTKSNPAKGTEPNPIRHSDSAIEVNHDAKAALNGPNRAANGTSLRSRKQSSKTTASKSHAQPSSEKSKSKQKTTSSPDDEPGTNEEKFVTAGWRFIQYGFSTLVGVYVLSQQNWVGSAPLFFEGWPNMPMSQLEKIYYAVGWGNYFYASVEMFASPAQRRQKDFAAMTIHHITTLFLIWFSYLWGFHRIGQVILLLHDCSDPVMELAKCFLYSGRQRLADIAFAAFALVFFVTRNVIFPVHVISSVPLYAYHDDGSKMPFGNNTINWILVAALSTLEVLHIYWFYLIMRIAIKAVRSSGVQGDVRDHDLDDDDE